MSIDSIFKGDLADTSRIFSSLLRNPIDKERGVNALVGELVRRVIRSGGGRVYCESF